MSSWGIVCEKQRGESFDSPPCRNSHAGTLLGLTYIKGRTIWQTGAFPLFFNSLRFAAAPGAVNRGHGREAPDDKICRLSSPFDPMKTHLRWILVCLLVFAAAVGCSRKPHAAHATESHAPEPPPPTPDTTPIPVLRTPAGLVLGVEGTPAPSEPTPGAEESVNVPPPTPVP